MIWNITKLRCLPDSLLVKRILWENGEKTGESEPHAYFVQPAFKDLTQDNVIEWIEAYIGSDALADFTNYVSPVLDPNSDGPLVEPDLPWNIQQ